jgi:hypothetical protein
VRDGTLISCSAFSRHRHDAPAQYDLGSTLYPKLGCSCSRGWGGVGGDDAGAADRGCDDADGGDGGCDDAAGAEGSSDDADGADEGGKDAGRDLAVWFALTLRFGSSPDVRLGEQVGHFKLDLAVAGAVWGGR